MCFVWRPVTRADIRRLEKQLRPADRRELAASHPREKTEDLLRQFLRVSAVSYALTGNRQTAAVGGITSRGCVWLLTARAVEKCPKTFFKSARKLLTEHTRQWPLLYNWVDERYLQARAFITHLGGTFDGSFVVCNHIRFLFFYFRRPPMGGIMNQSAVKSVSTALSAFEKRNKQKQTYLDQAQQQQKSLEAWQHTYRQETDYLFRSAAERVRALQEQARLDAAQRQTKTAKNGLNRASATVQLIDQKENWQHAQQAQKLEQETVNQLQEKNSENQTKTGLLARNIQRLKKAANQKSTLWKWGKQLMTWF